MSDGDGGQQRMVERAIDGEMELDARLEAEHRHCEAVVDEIHGWVDLTDEGREWAMGIVKREREDALADGLELAAQVIEMCMRVNTVAALAAAIRALKPVRTEVRTSTPDAPVTDG